MHCRFCKTKLIHTFIDLVNAPLSNAFLTEAQLDEPEVFYPLKLYVCHECHLVQIEEHKKSSDIFNQEYAYFSSFSSSWIAHCKAYTEKIIPNLGLNKKSLVIEIASNDGYLLQHFKAKNIPCLGIEPAVNTAEVARKKGIETITDFFGSDLARQLAYKGRKPDLLIGNNVLAHVPDINDFVNGMKIILADHGVITMEFPHLLRMVEGNQFDTIYHEHFSYLSFHTVQRIFKEHGLAIFDVEELPTHGGSLRVYARHDRDEIRSLQPGVALLLEKEKMAGMMDLAFYAGFQDKTDSVKYGLLDFLLLQKKSGKKVAAYGAAAKGNTLLNYCGIKKDLIEFVVDASPNKQGKFLPGSHIPVLPPQALSEQKPDYVMILPWNIAEEVMQQQSGIQEWGGRFIVAIPGVAVL